MKIFKLLIEMCAVASRWVSHRNVFYINNTQNIEHNNSLLAWHLNDPQCYLKAKNCLSPKMNGFYMLELSCGILTKHSTSVFYFDAGRGFNDKDSFALRMTPGKTIKRIVYFNESIFRLRWDPSSQGGAAENVKIEFVKLTKTFALKRINEKLAAKGVGKVASERSVVTLYKYYDLLFCEQTGGRYEDWITYMETTLWHKSMVKAGPLFSIVVPVFNTDPKYLYDCVESVVSQTYSHWQLILVDDASTNNETITALRSIHNKTEDRIKIVWREKNGHISRASNTGLEHVLGEYVAFLDHDDLLSTHALNELSAAIELNPGVDLFYSDEDKINTFGQRYEPHFKPDFSPDLLLSQNYISHISVLKTSLVKRVGGFRVGYEGSQDHDLLLRCLPYLNNTNVVHIPKVLYHWRAIDGSTALNANEKNYTEAAGIKALSDYACQNTCGAIAMHAEGANTYRLKWPLINNPFVTLLIPTRDRLSVLKPCVDSILDKTEYDNFEIIILNNDSKEKDTLAYFQSLKNHDKVRIVKYSGEFNFSAINNFGVAHARGSILGLINNDIEVIKGDWLSEMVSHVLRPEIGCVGAKLLYRNGYIQHGGVILGMGGVANHSHLNQPGNTPGYFERMRTVHNVSAVTGACLLVRKSLYEEVGGLNELSLKVAFNDVDFCLKVREAGYRNVFTPFATLYHHESISRGEDDTPEKQARFASEVEYMKNTWGKHLLNDPYYNSNFDLEHGANSYSLRNYQ